LTLFDVLNPLHQLAGSESIELPEWMPARIHTNLL
jgi:hypothetical protein